MAANKITEQMKENFERCAQDHDWEKIKIKKCRKTSCPYHLASAYGHKDFSKMKRTCLIEALDKARGPEEDRGLDKMSSYQGMAMSCEEIGEIFGITKQRVGQIIKEAMQKIRERITPEDLRKMLSQKDDAVAGVVPDEFDGALRHVLRESPVSQWRVVPAYWGNQCFIPGEEDIFAFDYAHPLLLKKNR